MSIVNNDSNSRILITITFNAKCALCKSYEKSWQNISLSILDPFMGNKSKMFDDICSKVKVLMSFQTYWRENILMYKTVIQKKEKNFQMISNAW